VVSPAAWSVAEEAPPANILLVSDETPQELGASQLPFADFTSFASVVALPVGGPNCGDGLGPLTNTVAEGYNFSDDDTCGFTGTGDRQNAGSPQIGALAGNGGPTMTRLPAATSPLIDGVPLAQCKADGASTVTTDQRGVTRPQGSGCDIGSVEVVPEAVQPEQEVVLQPTFPG
jgi:hypothetical protein